MKKQCHWQALIRFNAIYIRLRYWQWLTFWTTLIVVDLHLKSHCVYRSVEFHLQGGSKNWNTFVRFNFIRLNFIKYWQIFKLISLSKSRKHL